MKHWLLLACVGLVTPALSQSKKKATTSAPAASASSSLFKEIKFRSLGPYRGGRSAAVAGSYTQKNTFYMGATGGGLWKTTDAGASWKNISDGFFGNSIGAVAVAPSNEQVIYVGEGENTMRGNVSEGLGGAWKSTDGGKTWQSIGLKEGRHIIRMVVHPQQPDVVWAAVMGHLFGPNEERGVFKTTDGGKTWKRVLYVNNQTGASDLVIDPNNPNILFAGTWRLIRTPYSLESGGDGSGLWRSEDGGETWKNISTANGLPKGVWGIVGVAVAPSNSDRVYAILENANGGMYRSDDGGINWELVSKDNNIRQRAWYYTKVFVDPKNQDVVYAPNVGFMRSRDGGKTFQSMATPHGDHHDLWIDPQDPNRMIVADDGGAQVSLNGGTSWSTYENQPTAQIYRVSTDNSFPYRILGAQQDNSTFRMYHRTFGTGISSKDWEETAGAESGYVVADPLNPDIVYGGNYGGYLSRLDHKTGENRAVSVYPDNPMGAGADVQKYRFQWNFPIFFSPHNPKRLYAAGNHLFVTEDEGQSWKVISPDLTTNDKSKQKSSGGPITQDNTSVEYYCTIFTATESIREKDVLWTGSDDGLIHVSKDGGKTWSNVTPANAPKAIMWNSIETAADQDGVAYFAGTRYKSDDFAPYLYKTTDYGKTWTKITNGIPQLHFTRVLRKDPIRSGLLYAGTEYGLYISFDDGANWMPFQQNLPVVPITDMTIRDNDLIVATQGRSFWMLDDLSMLQQYNPSIADKALHVYQPEAAWRIPGMQSFGGRRQTPTNLGQNPPNGVVLQYWIKEKSDSALAGITIRDEKGQVIKQVSTNAKEDAKKLTVKKGHNTFVWNLLVEGGDRIDDMILWNGVPGGIVVPPGNYTATVTLANDSVTVPVSVKADPRFKATTADYVSQYQFLLAIKDQFNAAQKGVKDCRLLREQLSTIKSKADPNQHKSIITEIDNINKQLTSIEETLYQTKAKSGQDVLNYPIRLNDKMAGLFDTVNSGYNAPSQQSREVFSDLSKQIQAQVQRLDQLKSSAIPALNQAVKASDIHLIGVK